MHWNASHNPPLRSLKSLENNLIAASQGHSWRRTSNEASITPAACSLLALACESAFKLQKGELKLSSLSAIAAPLGQIVAGSPADASLEKPLALGELSPTPFTPLAASTCQIVPEACIPVTHRHRKRSTLCGSASTGVLHLRLASSFRSSNNFPRPLRPSSNHPHRADPSNYTVVIVEEALTCLPKPQKIPKQPATRAVAVCASCT